MKKNYNNSMKAAYCSPEISSIRLDQTISLALESAPPTGPDELVQQTPEYFRNDLFDNRI